MNRRRFLQALFAVPCLGAPLLVPRPVEVSRWEALGVDYGTADQTMVGWAYFRSADYNNPTVIWSTWEHVPVGAQI